MTIPKVNIDFQIIDTSDPRYMIIADTSEWGGIEGKPAVIEIQVPGVVEPAIHYFDQKSVNVFNSITLGVNCVTCGLEEMELPDGIYEVELKGSPSKYNQKRQYLRTTSTELELDRLLVQQIDNTFKLDTKVVEKIMEIEVLLKTAKAHVRFRSNEKAHQLFLRVQKLIKEMDGCNL